jgi:hypothetical protein
VPKLRLAIQALGSVRHLVSPNCIHDLHVADWKHAFPGAIAWASSGVRERAASQHVDVTFDRDLGDTPEATWKADLDPVSSAAVA